MELSFMVVLIGRTLGAASPGPATAAEGAQPEPVSADSVFPSSGFM